MKYEFIRIKIASALEEDFKRNINRTDDFDTSKIIGDISKVKNFSREEFIRRIKDSKLSNEEFDYIIHNYGDYKEYIKQVSETSMLIKRKYL